MDGAWFEKFVDRKGRVKYVQVIEDKMKKKKTKYIWGDEEPKCPYKPFKGKKPKKIVVDKRLKKNWDKVLRDLTKQ
jgi:hypothetical protein